MKKLLLFLVLACGLAHAQYTPPAGGGPWTIDGGATAITNEGISSVSLPRFDATNAEATSVISGGLVVSGNGGAGSSATITDSALVLQAAPSIQLVLVGGAGGIGLNGPSISLNAATTFNSTATFNGAVTLGGGAPLTVNANEINFTNLPTADPSVSGRLWNDTGTLKISAGP